MATQFKLFSLFPSTSTSGLVVYLGRETQQSLNPNEQSRTVSQVINHPSYNSQTHDNDIALLQLSSTVEFTDYIKPVCLAASGSTFDAGTTCWVTGWGDIRSGGKNWSCFLILIYFMTVWIHSERGNIQMWAREHNPPPQKKKGGTSCCRCLKPVEEWDLTADYLFLIGLFYKTITLTL